MPTNFTDIEDGDIIYASHITELREPIQALERGAAFYGGESGGSSTAYELTMPHVPDNPYPAGMIVNFKVHVQNDEASPDVTLNVNGIGAKPLRRNNGIALLEADLKEGQMVSVIYDSADGGQFFLLYKISETLAGVIDLEQVEGLVEALDDKMDAPPSTPSYSNVLGSGDRRSLIAISSNHPGLSGALSNMLDGTQNNNFYWSGTSSSGIFVRFAFPSRVQITEAQWYQDNASVHGTWKWQASNDGITWVNIGSPFTLGGSETQVQTRLAGNPNRYKYYQLLGVSGNTSSSPWLREIEFKINAVSLAEAFLTIPTNDSGDFLKADGTAGPLEPEDLPGKEVLILPKTASQTVNSSSTDKLTYNTASTNDGAFTVSSSVLTTVVAGDYLFEIPCFVSGGSNPYHIQIVKNGSIVYKSEPCATICNVVKKLRLAPADTVEFRLQATTASCLVDTTDAYLNNVVVTRLN